MELRVRRGFGAVAIGIAALAVSGEARAGACDPPVATATSVQGSIEVRTAGASAWAPVNLDDTFCAGDTLRAGRRSRADVQLGDASVLRIRAGTEMTFEGVSGDGVQAVDMLKGAAHFFSRTGDGKLDVKTPFTVAGVRGTEFLVESDDSQSEVTVYGGRVLAQSAAGSLNVADGQTVVASAGAAPALRAVAKSRDAVEWALYYPPVLYLDADAFPDGGDWRGKVRASSDAYLRGDTGGALGLLGGVDETAVDDARYFAYKASLLLAVGSVDEARASLDRALALAPDHADALALQSIVALTGGERERSLELARRAVASGPDSATALIALSYAQQAGFDLRSARASAEQAVEVAPGNAFAWARLAELRSSFGEKSGALAAARRATEIEPDVARTQTVLGFTQLAEIDTEGARASFEKAIALDQADPLPRLGLGLAMIREGHLDEGAREIEIAASLDPNRSITRSYMGKAYFEEKRTDLDRREFEVAKELDPLDPTPWFYDALALQTTNRPVEALRANQKAIELNDNRGVYRSALLLDSDLAARSAALGRIYGDLGFQSLALVEGWKSLNIDPSNFSAHRLLADSYAALPRHEIARVSELLQSQLLQPTNIAPIQPRLGEGNLFLVSSQGPSAISTSEFNPLFNRNGYGLQANGLFAEDDTQSGEGIVSAIYDSLSVSGGYSFFTTDGFRANNDLEDQIGTAFAQYELSPQTSIQTEYRYRKVENGDVEVRYFEDSFSRSREEWSRSHTARVGARHEFSPHHTVLASYIFSHRDSTFDDMSPFGFPIGIVVDIATEQRAHSGETQYLFRSGELDWIGGLIQSVNVTSGVGYADVDVVEEFLSTITFQPPPIILPFPLPPIILPPVEELISEKTRPDVRHANVYAYSNVSMPYGFDLTLGVSGDFFKAKDGVGKVNQANPKVGLTWNPPWVPGMTVRGAAFRTLKRTLVNLQTLEPTQVAGFNQFFDDISGTRAWRYGAAVDQKFTDAIFGGVEFSKRDLKVPFNVVGDSVETSNWDEYLTRLYFFWTPCDWLAFRAEYQWEKFERETTPIFAFERVVTHRVPFGVAFFHPIGLSASFGATFVDQKGRFDAAPGLLTPVLTPGHKDFWILDTALRYRLPKRYGFVTFGVNNLTDEDTTYQATDFNNPDLRPSRFIYGSLTLAFP